MGFLQILCSAMATVGLLIATTSTANADPLPRGTVSQITDDRIRESSGLALSVKHDDLVYTVNDRGSRPAVYAVQLSTGQVVGVTDVRRLGVEDTESIAVDNRGTLWLGDLGDNDHERNNVSIISFPEPGPGDHELDAADRYGVTLPDGPVDVEGMLVHPTTNRVFLVSKIRNGLGSIYRLPALTPGETATAEDLDAEAPQAVTDGTFTHDGRWALLRTEDEVWTYDPKTWKPVNRLETPELEQGESITVDRGDRSILLGSEGSNSPIVRVSLPDQSAVSEPIELVRPSSAVGSDFLKVLGLGFIGIVLVGGVIAARKRLRGR